MRPRWQPRGTADVRGPASIVTIMAHGAPRLCAKAIALGAWRAVTAPTPVPLYLPRALLRARLGHFLSVHARFPAAWWRSFRLHFLSPGHVPRHASVLFPGTALPWPVFLRLEQFVQHTAGLLQILESLGADSVDLRVAAWAAALALSGSFFASPCGEFAWDGRVSSWHICINKSIYIFVYIIRVIENPVIIFFI